MKLIIARHGKTIDKWEKLVDGAKDLPLSEAGIEQIKVLANHLDESKLDVCYSSTLQRAYNTAKILTKGKKTIIKDSRLVELRMGCWKKGLNHSSAFDQLGNVQEKYIKYANNAETFDEIKRRCQEFFDDLKTKYPHKTIFIVSHGICIRAMISVLFHEDMNYVTNLDNVAFTEIYLNEKDNFRPYLLSYNSRYPMTL